MTPGVQASVPLSELLRAFRRHAAGDWGDVPKEDARSNDAAIGQEERILSEYRSTGGVRFWIITEADRSLTSALLPEEY